MNISIPALQGQGLLDENKGLTEGGIAVLTELIGKIPLTHESLLGELSIVSVLQGLGFLDAEKKLTEYGKEALAELLGALPPYHKGGWGPAFRPLMSKMVPACIELVIIRESDGAVLLTYRDDAHFKGWHTPGTYISPRETRQETVTRCASEIGVPVVYIKDLPGFDHPDNPRFHDQSTLVLCRAEGDPQAGKWFITCPPDLIAVHQPYWPVIDNVMTEVARKVPRR